MTATQMELASDFAQFLHEIRLTDHQRGVLRDGHALLRKRLCQDNDLAPILVSDFLQGSYRRHTAVRPKSGSRADVDIIVVTKLDEADHTPTQAMDVFVPFLDRHYEGKWRRQGRSFGIDLSAVDFDLVVTSAPSESELGILQSEAVSTLEDVVQAADWRLHRSWVAVEGRGMRADAAALLKEASSEPEWPAEPLRIPDRNANCWGDTHPLEQIRWTRDKNQSTETHFVNIVKAVKWWRLEKHAEPSHPKGFPLERIVGDCCNDGIGSVAQGVVCVLENVASRYQPYVDTHTKPHLADYGVSSHDVLARLSFEDFAAFVEQASDAAPLARRAIDSADRVESGNLWRDLLGSKFPAPPGNGGGNKKGYTIPDVPAVPGSGRFA